MNVGNTVKIIKKKWYQKMLSLWLWKEKYKNTASENKKKPR